VAICNLTVEYAAERDGGEWRASGETPTHPVLLRRSLSRARRILNRKIRRATATQGMEWTILSCSFWSLCDVERDHMSPHRPTSTAFPKQSQKTSSPRIFKPKSVPQPCVKFAHSSFAVTVEETYVVGLCTSWPRQGPKPIVSGVRLIKRGPPPNMQRPIPTTGFMTVILRRSKGTTPLLCTYTQCKYLALYKNPVLKRAPNRRPSKQLVKG